MSVQMSDLDDCPCFSGNAYHTCCKPFMQGEAWPETPLALLRSRYTAFALKNIDYLERTMRAKAAISFNTNYLRKFINNVDCIALHIQHSKVGQSQAIIEYKAIFKHKEHLEKQTLHQYSFFNRIDNHWYHTNEYVVD